MRLEKIKKLSVLVTEDILCNSCGESCKGERNFNGLIEAQVVSSYDSTHLTYTNEYCFSLCEKCLSKMFKKFKISPNVNDDDKKVFDSYLSSKGKK